MPGRTSTPSAILALPMKKLWQLWLARGLVMPQRLDVDVPGLPKQDREHGGAEDVAVRAGVVASVADGEVPAEPVEEPRGLQEHRKVRKPPCGGDLRAGSPIDFEPPSECGNVDGAANCGTQKEGIFRLPFY